MITFYRLRLLSRQLSYPLRSQKYSISYQYQQTPIAQHIHIYDYSRSGIYYLRYTKTTPLSSGNNNTHYNTSTVYSFTRRISSWKPRPLVSHRQIYIYSYLSLSQYYPLCAIPRSSWPRNYQLPTNLLYYIQFSHLLPLTPS